MAQQPAYAAVVILSLSLGFAACFLLLGYVQYSFSYDRQVPDAGRVFLVKDRIMALALLVALAATLRHTVAAMAISPAGALGAWKAIAQHCRHETGLC